MIKKKEIVEAVADTTSLKKYQAREALEAMLGFVHEKLSAGDEVQIPPLGKIRVVLQNEGTPREKTVYRLILSKPKTEGDADTESKTKEEASLVVEPQLIAEESGSNSD